MAGRKRLKQKGRKTLNPSAIQLEGKDLKDKNAFYQFWSDNNTCKSFGQAKIAQGRRK